MKFNNGHLIENFSKPYFIAELNTSHLGNIETAMEMIREAKIAGCDCVKFQSWSAESLYSKTYYKKNPVARRFVDKFSLSSDTLCILSDYCKSVGISFASTPYSTDEVDFLLNKCDVPFIKIASMEINNYPYLEYIAKTGSAIILSTGMADFDEVSKAVNIISEAGNDDLCLLHCVSIYPAAPSSINLNNIINFREKLKKYPVGYSDHTVGIETPVAAVSIGAPVIEKHFTLDSKKIGMDNQMAMEPSDFMKMINSCRIAWESLGSFERLVSFEEVEQRVNMRRSIVSKHSIKRGETITLHDLTFKRPGDGFPPSEISALIGKKAKLDIDGDEVIYDNMIE